MTSRTSTDDAIVTGLVPYSEADLVVRLFGRERGRFSAFARSARRSKKRFGGSLATLAIGRAELRAGKGMVTLTGFDASPALFGLAEPEVYGRAAYLVEVTERLLPEAEPAPELFGWLAGALEHLGRLGSNAALLRAYELQLLKATGYLPDLDTASDLEDEVPVALEPRTGALVAEPSEHAIGFGERARALTKRLLESGPHALPEADAETLRVVSRLFATHLRRMGTSDLKSLAFLKQLM